MESIYKNLGVVEIPSFKKERQLYMHKTLLNKIELPSEYEEFLPTIQQIVKKVPDCNGVCYITIDEKIVNNETHRRSGIHVDLNWYENINSHGNPRPGHKLYSKWDTPKPGTWGGASEHYGGMLLVSNYEGCKVYKGEFEGEMGEGGDCSKIKVDRLNSEVMKPNEVYFVNAYGIHESLLIKGVAKRTLIRINFHPNYLFNIN